MEAKDLDKVTADLDAKAAEVEKKYQSLRDEKKKLEEEKANMVAAAGMTSHVSGGAGSDEKRALSYFGCRHVKDLLNINTGDIRFKHVPAELKGMVQELKADFDISRQMQQMFNGEPLDRKADDTDRFTAVKGVLDGNYWAKHVLAPKLKAFGTGAAGEGQEWVPTAISSQFIEEFELDRQIAAQFRVINMPSNPFEIPVQTGVTRARIQSESCDPADNVAATNWGTTNLTFSATKLVEHICLPEELNEDSAPAILGESRSEITDAQHRAVEDLLMNGDTTGTHMDSDVTAASDARKLAKGLRKLALENSATVDFTASAVALTKLRDMRTLMGKFGVSTRDLMWGVSAKVYNQMLALNEVTTVEKFGPNATILRGALAALDGIPIVISEYNRDDLNASGVYDGVTTNLSEVKLINRRRFMIGQRRPIRTKVVMDPTPPGDRWILASWQRLDFQGHAQSASEISVVQGINVV